MSTSPTVANPVDVTVLVVTYNHAPYVEQALRSVAAQETERSFEIIISEDCSTDETRALVTDFADRDSRARLLLSTRNLRSNDVVARGIRSAQGRYLCLLDGDDYWTSPTKLERQATLLDEDPTLSACFHNARVDRGDGRLEDLWTPVTQAARVTADEIWSGNPYATSAGMLRVSALDALGGWYDDFFPITDWPLYIICAEHGDIAFDDEPVAVYRLHDGGEFSSLPVQTKFEMMSSFYQRMDAALAHRSHDRATAGASRYFFDWARVFADQGDRKLGRSCLRLCLRAGGVGTSVGRREFGRCAWQLR
jgi:glycosyltransferase involved in cell wall biosynthesis